MRHWLARARYDALDQRVLGLLESSPGLTCCQVCRSLNGADQGDCYNCLDFGNANKRKKGILVAPSCHIRKGGVWRSLRRLASCGCLVMRRERRRDHYMARGWDWMMGFYPGPWLPPSLT